MAEVCLRHCRAAIRPRAVDDRHLARRTVDCADRHHDPRRRLGELRQRQQRVDHVLHQRLTAELAEMPLDRLCHQPPADLVERQMDVEEGYPQQPRERRRMVVVRRLGAEDRPEDERLDRLTGCIARHAVLDHQLDVAGEHLREAQRGAAASRVVGNDAVAAQLTSDQQLRWPDIDSEQHSPKRVSGHVDCAIGGKLAHTGHLQRHLHQLIRAQPGHEPS
ncbi:hypothetical protein HRbin26_01978 [bacterium HR26]|nr:hypothetical protein HRbin26_01978 [bacterium HR26]